MSQTHTPWSHRLLPLVTCILAVACTSPDVGVTDAGSRRASTTAADAWLAHGNDPGATRFAPASQITQANVGDLEITWSYRIARLERVRCHHPASRAILRRGGC